MSSTVAYACCLLVSLVAAGPAVAEDPLSTAPTLTGTWYLRIRTATDARIRILGNTHIRSTTHLLVHIEEGPDGLQQHQQTCTVDTRPSRNITRTILPEAFITHLPQKSYPISFVPSPDGGWIYTADLQQQYVGYDGTRAPDGIPEDAKHPAVYDWDEDGKPGASVLVDLPIFGHIRIYLVQTNHTVLKGRLQPSGRITGTTHQRIMMQRTIGADNRLLAGSPRLSIGTGHDAFELGRIEAKATCTDIKRLAGDSF